MKSNNFKSYFRRNGSTWLSILASFGVVATAYFAGKGTYDAIKKLEQVDKDRNYTKKEKAKAVARYYIPAVGIGLSTIFCINSANVLSKKQSEAIASAYMLLNRSYTEYRNKVKEVNGVEGDEEIIRSIPREKFPEERIPENKIMFYEEYSHRYFYSTMEDVLLAILHYNRNFQLRGCVSLNEFYEFLGIKKIECGDYVGFSWHEMSEGGLMPWIDIRTIRAVNCEDQWYYIISFDWMPICNYENFDSFDDSSRYDFEPSDDQLAEIEEGEVK